MPISNDQQISTGGTLQDAPRRMYFVDSAVYWPGTAVTFKTSEVDENGDPYVTLADKNDVPVGFAYLSTVDPRIPYEYQTSSSYQSDVPCSVNRYERGQRISVPLCAGHAAIAIGEKVAIYANGEHDKLSAVSGATWSIGYALRAIDANTDSLGTAGLDADFMLIWVDVQKES
ncbi:MAG: hypothetical protein M0R80_09935 [Proteobacteria bacterium]|nr:hypothetical protein [Pseudomonadota bacterium]